MSDKTCKSCKYFHQHYILTEGRIVRVFCGHCIFPKVKSKRPYSKACENYIYDEQYDSYYCDMNLDEDEMMHFLTGSFGNCPYYRDNDEYRIVRKQN